MLTTLSTTLLSSKSFYEPLAIVFHNVFYIIFIYSAINSFFLASAALNQLYVIAEHCHDIWDAVALADKAWSELCCVMCIFVVPLRNNRLLIWDFVAIVIARFEVLKLVLNFLLKLNQFQFHGCDASLGQDNYIRFLSMNSNEGSLFIRVILNALWSEQNLEQVMSSHLCKMSSPKQP